VPHTNILVILFGIFIALVTLAVFWATLKRIRSWAREGKLKKYTFVAAAFGIGATVFVHIWISHSEPFEISKTYISQNAKVTEAVGKIMSVRLKIFGSSSLNWRGNIGEAKLSIVVKGSKQTATVHMELSENENTWKITKGILFEGDGKTLEIAP